MRFYFYAEHVPLSVGTICEKATVKKKGYLRALVVSSLTCYPVIKSKIITIVVEMSILRTLTNITYILRTCVATLTSYYRYYLLFSFFFFFLEIVDSLYVWDEVSRAPFRR